MPPVSSPGPACRIRLPTLFASGGQGGFRPGLGRRFGGGRDLDVEDRPATVVRLDPDSALHAAHELVRDVETEARSADASLHVRVEPVELFEDPALFPAWDPEALVGDREAHA